VLLKQKILMYGGQGNAYFDVDVANNGASYRLSESVDIQSTGDVGGGFNIGWIRDNEWLEYLVNVNTATNYTFRLRVAASTTGGSLRMYLDGEALGTAIAIPATGGIGTYQDVNVTYNLPQGLHVLKVEIVKGGFNFNKITVVEANRAPTNLTLSASSIAREPCNRHNVVGTFSTTDPDAGNTFTYSACNWRSRQCRFYHYMAMTLRTNAVFDFETKSSYSIRVRTTDQGGFFFEKTVTITIVRANFPVGSPVAENGKLRVEGNQLVNQCGKPIQLKGFGSHGLQWFPNCYNEESIKSLVHDWGIDVFEIKINYGLFYEKDTSNARRYVDNLVELFTELGVYVIIQNVEGENPLDWIDIVKTEFTYFCRKHKDKINIIYEPLNEPYGEGGSWENCKIFAGEVIPVIRAIVPDAVIIMATPSFCTLLDVVADDPLTGDLAENVIYSLHIYAHSHDIVMEKFRYASAKIPIFAAEWGICTYTGSGELDFEATDIWLDMWNGNNPGKQLVSWANHNFADGPGSACALQQGACNGNLWGNATPSGAYIREKILLGDNWESCGGATMGAIVYSEIEYGGSATKLPIGNYSLAQMVALGVNNDDISSLKVPNGLKIEVYEHDSFNVLLGTYYSNIVNLDALGIGNKISSLKISALSKPIKATQLTATALSDNSIRLTWTDNANNELEYIVERSSNNGFFVQIATLPPNTVAYTDTGIEENSTYYYRIVASSGEATESSNSVMVRSLVALRKITLSATAINENLAIGTTVATLTTTDPDAANTFTYSLAAGGTDNASFTITGNTLKTNAIFDFETKSSYSIRVRSTDQGGLFFERTFTITVTDVEETTYWDFATDLEGWNTPNNLTATVNSGIATFAITGSDPFIHSANNLNIPAALYNYVVIRMQNQTGASTAELFWTTTTDGAFNGTKRVGIPIVPNDTKQRYYIVDMSTNPHWTGLLKQLRLDPTIASSGTVHLDFLKLTGAYPSVAAIIPGTIEAENFNRGGQGNGYNDATPTSNSGNQYRTNEGVDMTAHTQQATNYVIGWTAAGEWLEYIVRVEQETYYSITANVSSPSSTARIAIELNGEQIAPEIPVPNTGSFNTYEPVEVITSKKLAIGTHVLRIHANTGSFNIDKLVFADAVKTQEIALQKGWNLISVNVLPDCAGAQPCASMEIQTIFAGLDVQEIKTMNHFWRKDQPDFLNSLQSIAAGQGYLVKMNTAGILTIIGTPLTINNLPLTINDGWNLIGYPSGETSLAPAPFSNYFNATNAQIIKSFDGFWVPNGTLNSIENFEVGKGYFIKK
jgi:hypothetical protein